MRPAAGSLRPAAGKSPQNDLGFEQRTYKTLLIWRDPFRKKHEGNNFYLCVFFRMGPQIPEFQRSVYLMNFCSKAPQTATVSPQKNQQKNPRHGGNMQNQLFPSNLKGVRQRKQYLKGNDDPAPQLSGIKTIKNHCPRLRCRAAKLVQGLQNDP